MKREPIWAPVVAASGADRGPVCTPSGCVDLPPAMSIRPRRSGRIDLPLRRSIVDELTAAEDDRESIPLHGAGERQGVGGAGLHEVDLLIADRVRPRNDGRRRTRR